MVTFINDDELLRLVGDQILIGFLQVQKGSLESWLGALSLQRAVDLFNTWLPRKHDRPIFNQN